MEALQTTSCSGRCLTRGWSVRNHIVTLRGRRTSRGRIHTVFVAAKVLTPLAEDTTAERQALWKDARLITAIKTPYTRAGRIDMRAFDRLVEHQIDCGVNGLIIGGTTGEGQLMNWEEHLQLIAHTAKAYEKQLLVVGNTGSNSTREALHATTQGFAVGMDAALQINPYYGKTSVEGLRKHFSAVLQEGPAIIYNVPGRTGQDIPDSVIDEMASHPNFLGVKECTGNARIQRHSGKGISCWTGNDDEAFEARHKAGAVGAISVASNIFPGLYAKMMADSGAGEAAASVAELIDWLFCEPNPIPVNTAMAMCGLVQPVFRLPYVPLSQERREQGAKLLQAVLPHLPGVQDIQILEDSDFELVSTY